MVRKNNLVGYTLLEMIIVLGIFMVLILLAYRPIKITWQNYEERQFIKNFERKWNQSTIKSIQEEKHTNVYFYHDLVRFSEYNKDRTTNDYEFSYPSTMHGDTNIVKISDNGSVTPKTIKIFSSLGRRYVFVFQMGYDAKYYVKTYQ